MFDQIIFFEWIIDMCMWWLYRLTRCYWCLSSNVKLYLINVNFVWTEQIEVAMEWNFNNIRDFWLHQSLLLNYRYVCDGCTDWPGGMWTLDDVFMLIPPTINFSTPAIFPFINWLGDLHEKCTSKIHPYWRTIPSLSRYEWSQEFVIEMHKA